MSSLDRPSDEHPLISAEPEISPKIVAAALARLGFDFDPSKDEDLEKAARYVDSMLTDLEKTDALVEALLSASREDADHVLDVPQTDRAFVPIRLLGERTSADDVMMSDAPSRGRLLTVLEDRGEA